MRIASAFVVTLATWTLAGCGGGGGAGSATVEPLTVPSQMTVIAAQDTQTGSLRLIPDRRLGSGKAVTGTRRATGTDYQTDETHLYVHDDSMEVLGTINDILTMLGQTGYSDPDVLNAGPYLALVEKADSSSKGADPTNGGDTASGSTQVELMEWVVRSDRASATAPHIVQFWIDWEEERDGSPSMSRIYGKLTITEAPSDSLPYGRFTLNFKMLDPSSAPDAEPIFHGTLSTVSRDDGRAEYTFYESEGDITQTPPAHRRYSLTRARVVADPAGTTGTAYTAQDSKWNDGVTVSAESSAYHVAFNQGYMARRTVHGTTQIEAFSRTAFTTYPWRYGLYDATTEARVQLQSGFGIKTADGARGYAGYHGIWFPDTVTVTNGMPVTRDSFGQAGAPESYTVFLAPGKLEKRTRTASTLGNLKNENLYTWDQANQRNITVQWTGSDLVKTAYFDREGGQWVDINPPVSIVSDYMPNQWIGLGSPARGEVNFTWPASGNPDDNTPVSIWGVSTVTSAAAELAGGDLTLYGYFQMLRPNLTQAQVSWSGGQSPFYPDATSVGEGKAYVFSKTSLLLTLGGLNVTVGSGVSLVGTPCAGGIMSGSLVTTPLTSLGDLKDQTVTYRWQTGTQQWNQLRTLLDAQSQFVSFDPPLAFLYTHVDADSLRWNGKTFRLEYQGQGQLNGIPYEAAQGSDRWYPVIAIPSGTVLTNSSGSYKVKVLEAEQKMQSLSNPLTVIAQQGLDVMTGLTPPSNDYADPEIGAKPTVTDAPRFVAGVKQ